MTTTSQSGARAREHATTGAADAATTWGLGDYPLMAGRLAEAAAVVVQCAALGPGDSVLDVGCGTGNAAMLAAATGARVVGVDSEPRLLDIAGDRSRQAGLDVDFQLGDAVALDLPDDAFSAILSVFGVMYAPDHEAAVAEIARCSKPGARIILATWLPGSFMPAMGAALAPYLPAPPAASGPPSRWGDADALTALLRTSGILIDEQRESALRLRFANRVDACEFLVTTAGHVISQEPRLREQGRWHNLLDDLDTLIADHDDEPGDHVSLRLAYLLTSARLPREPQAPEAHRSPAAQPEGRPRRSTRPGGAAT